MSPHEPESGMAARLRELKAEWLPGQPLSRHTSLDVGGRADLIRIRDAQALPEIVRMLGERGMAWRFLGGGSNLLVEDADLSSIALHLIRGPRDVEFTNGQRVHVSAAANLGTAVMECAKRNLGGMEGLIGVPGTVGGALRMNAGAYGQQIGDVVRSVEVFRGSSGRIETLDLGDVKFEYRHTGFAPEDIMISALLELSPKPYAEIIARIQQCNLKRRASQPINEKSAGCIFKNPAGMSTGKMIDELGLKGTRVGGAVISERHGNFIVNRGGASAADIFKLMDLIREKVAKNFNVQLEEEVIVWKN